LGLLGVHTFFVSKRASTALPQTPQGRYFGNVLGDGRAPLPEADWICAAIVIFQGWDFVVSMFFEEHCTGIMMCHHLVAFVCGFFCLVYEVNPYYAGKHEKYSFHRHVLYYSYHAETHSIISLSHTTRAYLSTE